MKAGDVLASSACTWKSCLIRLGSWSKYSHVAMAISEEAVVEAANKKVSEVSKVEFLKDKEHVMLLQRPDELNEDQVEKLRDEWQKMNNADYSSERLILAVINPFAYLCWAVGCVYTLGYFFVKYGYIEIFGHLIGWAVILFPGLAFLGIRWLLKTFANPKSGNAVARRFHVPCCLLTDENKKFCSQLVMELDGIIDGKIKEKWIRSHEPWPKNIVSICSELKYREVQLKPKE